MVAKDSWRKGQLKPLRGPGDVGRSACAGDRTGQRRAWSLSSGYCPPRGRGFEARDPPPSSRPQLSPHDGCCAKTASSLSVSGQEQPFWISSSTSPIQSLSLKDADNVSF